MCVQKLEIIAGHQITGYGTCDSKLMLFVVPLPVVVTVTLVITSDWKESTDIYIEKKNESGLLSYLYRNP